MLVCPACSTPTLGITASLHLGADSSWDEVSIQALRCKHCGLTAAACYEESRRGRLAFECWEHWGVRITADNYAKLVSSLTACPEPSRSTCPCNAHRWFAQMSHLGRLQPLHCVPCIEGTAFYPELVRPK